MPFLAQDEDELKKQQSGQQISGQSTVLNAPQAAQKPGAPASSGQFKNIQTYLNANKEQAQQMGQQVVGSAEQSAQEAQQKQSQFQAAKPHDVQQQSAESLAQSYYDNPNAKKEEYTALKSTGGYTGPKSYNEMADYQAAQTATKKASEQVGQLQSQTGFEQAVAKQYERPQYSQGAKRLDASLIRGEEQSKKAAEQAYQNWGNLQNLLDQSVTSVQQQIEQNLATSQANKTLLPQAEEDYIQKLNAEYEQRATEQNKANKQNIDAIKADLADNLLTEESLKKSGLNLGQNIYDLNLQDFLRYDETPLQAKDVLTDQERANWDKLTNLLDRENLYKSGITVNPTTIDRESLNNALANASSVYEPQLQALLNKDYGISGSGWIGTDEGTFQELLNTYYDATGRLNPGTANSALGQALLTGDTSRLYPSDLQKYNDLQFWLKYNKQLGLEGSNVINAPAGSGLTRPITGSLKG